MLDLVQLQGEVLSWTDALGTYQLEHQQQRRDWQLGFKSSNIDPVTQIDRYSDEFLIDKIKAAYPQHSLMTEEGGFMTGDSDYLWIIDPLDGTVNYVHGLLIFAISIALLYRYETVMAVVAAPGLRQNFTAIRGQGSFLNGHSIYVSKQECLQQSLLATGFPYDRADDPDNNVTYAAHILPQVRGLRRLGSAAYDLACVAQGVYDGYWELNLKPWDVAAGKLLVTEAGGIVQPWPGKRGEALIAGNPDICTLLAAELCKVNIG